MPDWIETIIAESVGQYARHWAAMAATSGHGAVVETETLLLAIAGTAVPLFNLAIPKRPFRDAAACGAAALEAARAFAERRVPGSFTAPASWLPPGARAAVEAAGMPYRFSLMGMRTARLNDPRRPLRVEVTELPPEEAAEPLARVNGLAYKMPEEEWRQLLLPRFWQSGPRAYAVFDQGEAAAVGAAATAEGVSYLMWMATLPQYRRRGYAEAILRRAWSDARQRDGAKCTVLHATAKGRPLYAALGYVAVAEFPTFTSNGAV